MRSMPFGNENDGEINRHAFELWNWKEKPIFLLFCIRCFSSVSFVFSVFFSCVSSLIRKLYGFNRRFIDFSKKKNMIGFRFVFVFKDHISFYGILFNWLMRGAIHNFSLSIDQKTIEAFEQIPLFLISVSPKILKEKNVSFKFFILFYFSYRFSRNETDEWQLAVLHYVSDDNNNNDVKQLKNKKNAQQKYSLLFWSCVRARARSHTAVVHSLSIIIYK